MRALVILFTFILLATPVFSTVIGVTPADQTICVAPGHATSTVFHVSSSSSEFTEQLTVAVSNVPWVTTNKTIELPPHTQLPMLVIANPPRDLPEGTYMAYIELCKSVETPDKIAIQSCLGPTLTINVDKSCATLDTETIKGWFVWIAGTLIVLLLLVLGARKAGLISCPKKRNRKSR
jgi:hypothetical protein